MQLSWLSSMILTVLAVFHAVGTVNAKATCGTDGEVISNDTFVYNDKTYRMVTRTCPGIAARRSLESRSRLIRPRQYDICSYDASIECADLTSDLSVASCIDLADALEDQGSANFALQSETSITFYTDYGDCNYEIVNYSEDDLAVCYYIVGELGLTIDDDCGQIGGGYGYDDSDLWYLEVY
ncbi:uncharacterized protein LAESUDRAFT_730177 [Laetiporus sulphureus 93-53]|uniref:Ecp2 effector protein domain-containing protein n=1 Tax=Laetiporus sulphureus 93-53 TaxID=1314785 RepID=A0A165C9E4_9APHY|nr:uncharacterized protein LAESUDRAFT_730177 [Laetiporus sulphureus 93-53]KZT02430.1 hypothetical protein LAESUDRAFT_730177 [Laetiporus sulphureus 93-53]